MSDLFNNGISMHASPNVVMSCILPMVVAIFEDKHPKGVDGTLARSSAMTNLLKLNANTYMYATLQSNTLAEEVRRDFPHHISYNVLNMYTPQSDVFDCWEELDSRSNQFFTAPAGTVLQMSFGSPK